MNRTSRVIKSSINPKINKIIRVREETTKWRTQAT